jgi:glycosyltransferase involved in cell wall biosynthesis
MRVAHLLRKYNPAEWGGTETAIHRLFDGLRQHRVDSVVYAPKLEREPNVADPLRAAGCEVKRFKAFVPIWGMPEAEKRELVSVGGNLMSLDLIGALLRQKEISMVHSHALGRIGAIGWRAARWHKAPFVVTIHGGLLDLPEKLKANMRQPIKGFDWGKIFGLLLHSRRLLDGADAIVTCNPREAALLQQKFPRKRIQVQAHGVVLELYQKDSRETALKIFPALRGRDILLCVGRIDTVKNQIWLLEQMPGLLQKHPNAMLVLAGACTEEKYGKRIERRIAELGLAERVLLTGGLPPGDSRLIGLFQQAALLLLPSMSETFGLVLLEAWAAGTAVASSRTSGAKALIKEGENGWLFDLERPEEFHRAVQQCLTDASLRKRFAANGSELVATDYNTFALAGRMKRLYEDLIEEKHALRDSARR